MKAKLFFTAVALFGMALLVNAQTPYKAQGSDQATTGAKKSCYVDANNNGMCDLRESGQCAGNPVRQGLRQGPRDGQGIGRTATGRGMGNRGGNGGGVGRGGGAR